MFAGGAGLASGASLRTEAAAQLEALSADLEERLFPLLPDGSVGPARELVDVPFPGSDRLVYTARAVFEPGELLAPEFPRRVAVDVEVRWKEGGRRLALETQLLLTHSIPVGERLRRRFALGANSSFAAPPTPEPLDSTSGSDSGDSESR